MVWVGNGGMLNYNVDKYSKVDQNLAYNFWLMKIPRTINLLSTATSTSTIKLIIIYNEYNRHLIKSNQPGLIKPNQLNLL